MRCAIWYHLYNLKNVKSTHGGVLILVKLQAEAPPWVFFMFFNLYKWYQIVQRIIYTHIKNNAWENGGFFQVLKTRIITELLGETISSDPKSENPGSNYFRFLIRRLNSLVPKFVNEYNNDLMNHTKNLCKILQVKK